MKRGLFPFLLSGFLLLSSLLSPLCCRAESLPAEQQSTEEEKGAEEEKEVPYRPSFRTEREEQIYDRAQRMYEEIRETYPTADAYTTWLLNERRSYESTLREAKKYNLAYDYICDYSEVLVGVAITVACIETPKGMKDAITTVGKEYLNLIMDEMLKDLPSLSTETFVYAIANGGVADVKTAELHDIMTRAEKKGVYLASAKDAVRFITLVQGNKAGFAALAMGKSFYLEQLNAKPWDVLAGIIQRAVISRITDYKKPQTWMDEYVVGMGISYGTDLLELLAEQFPHPAVSAWAKQLEEIAEETEKLFTYIPSVSEAKAWIGTYENEFGDVLTVTAVGDESITVTQETTDAAGNPLTLQKELRFENRDSDPFLVCEPFGQGPEGSLVHYRLEGDEVTVTYPEGWWTPRVYQRK